MLLHLAGIMLKGAGGGDSVFLLNLNLRGFHLRTSGDKNEIITEGSGVKRRCEIFDNII